MSLDEIGAKGKKHASRLDKLILGSPSFFHFVAIMMTFLCLLSFGSSAVNALISGGAEGFTMFAIFVVLALVFAMSNFATAQLIGVLMRGFEESGNSGEKWARNLIFIPFTGIIVLSLPSLFAELKDVELSNKIIIATQIYIWLIYYSLRGISKSVQDIKQFVKNST